MSKYRAARGGSAPEGSAGFRVSRPGLRSRPSGVLVVAVVICCCRIACSGANRGAEITDHYQHPTLAQPGRPLAALSPMPPPDKTTEKEEPPARRPAAAPVPGGSERTARQEFRLPPLAANLDLRRTEMVRSAHRLLGVRRSFDDRSFIGHILRVNALLPTGARSATFPARAYRSLSRSVGRLVSAGSSLPGDIVFFRCENGCGNQSSEGVAAGVVVRVYGERLEFIGYVDSIVQNCYHGGTAPGKKARRVKELLGVATMSR